MIGSKRKAEPILKVGDLLITTGMDGIFPMGLRVGIVSQVMPLQEGACSYEISAKTTCGNLDHLSYLTVLPPTSK
jgi:cell shape-determining protein MreC